MKLFARFLGLLFTIVVIVLIAGAVFLVNFDPNEYKALVTEKVKEATGRELVINGPIEIGLFPTFELKLSDVTLSNPLNAGFRGQEFIVFKEAGLGVKVLPLLQQKIEVSDISITGLTARLVVLENGKNSWTFDTPKAKEAVKETAKPSETPSAMPDFTISSIKIADSTVYFEDKASGARISMHGFNANMSDVGLNKDMSADFALGFDNGSIMTDIKGDAVLNVNLDNEILTVKSFDISANDQALKGNLIVKSFTKPDIKFDVSSDRIDANKIVLNAGPESPAAAKVKKAPAKPVAVDFSFLNNMKLNGGIKVGELVFAPYTIKDVSAKVTGDYGSVKLDQSLEIFSGQIASVSSIYAKGNKVESQGVVTDLDLASLTKTLQGQDYVSGLLNTKYNITTSGATDKALLNNLSGSANANVGSGVISKWELSKRLNQILAIIKSGDISAAATAKDTASDSFEFTSVNADMLINTGVVNNETFTMKSPGMEVLGQGTVDLANQLVNYNLEPTLGKGLLEKSSVRSIPLKISGPFDNLKYTLDVQDAVKQKVKDEVKRGLDKVIDDDVKKKIDGFLGEGGTENLMKNFSF
jgi:AsmA protein